MSANPVFVSSTASIEDPSPGATAFCIEVLVKEVVDAELLCNGASTAQ